MHFESHFWHQFSFLVIDYFISTRPAASKSFFMSSSHWLKLSCVVHWTRASLTAIFVAACNHSGNSVLTLRYTDAIVCFASISNLSRYCRNFGRLDAMFNVYARTVPGTWAYGNIRSVYQLYHTTLSTVYSSLYHSPTGNICYNWEYTNISNKKWILNTRCKYEHYQ